MYNFINKERLKQTVISILEGFDKDNKYLVKKLLKKIQKIKGLTFDKKKEFNPETIFPFCIIARQ
ncbi:hypothetical protein BpHYR1_007437 [Brachionus plicatilis]|uniref:Uncharacterized protein n=1 Tax=Brachionus plicatilis TaxID=10195 RepID=A0A3M7PYY5_BRAPC|nr:hypothetical protein BpHYR1_007437 [Brachionus plicatilis]